MGGIGTGGVGRHIGDPVAFCAPPQPHRDSRATSTVWGHLRAVHQWETKTRPHRTPGCHHPTHLWPDAASPWRCGRGVLPALPPTPLPCMAAHPPAPSVPTVSPSWRSQRGEPSARERMEGGKVSGQPCWDPPTPPCSPLTVGALWLLARLAPARNGSCSNADAVARLAGSASKQRRMKALASSDMEPGTSGCALNIPTCGTGCTGTGHPAEGTSGLGSPPVSPPSAPPTRGYLKHRRLGAAQLVEGRFARGHLDDGAAQGPDIRRLPVAPRPTVDDFGGHVLQGAWGGWEG